jgi:hypothetical protein
VRSRSASRASRRWLSFFLRDSVVRRGVEASPWSVIGKGGRGGPETGVWARDGCADEGAIEVEGEAESTCISSSSSPSASASRSSSAPGSDADPAGRGVIDAVRVPLLQQDSLVNTMDTTTKHGSHFTVLGQTALTMRVPRYAAVRRVRTKPDPFVAAPAKYPVRCQSEITNKIRTLLTCRARHEQRTDRC